MKAAIAHGQTPAQKAVIDSLYRMAFSNYSTNVGLQYADRLQEAAQDINDYAHIGSAINLRAGSYINMGLYNRVFELADSIEEQPTLKKENPRTYDYIQYIEAQTYSYQGKYRLALDKAQQIYEKSLEQEKQSAKDKKDGQNSLSLSIDNRISALMCIAAAYGNMGEYDRAIDYYNECIEITKIDKVAFATDRRDAYDGRTNIALKLSDNERKLHYVREYEKCLNEYEQSGKKEIKDEKTDVYYFYLNDAYTNTYCSMGDYEKAKEYLDAETKIFSNIEMAYDNVAAQYYTTLTTYYKHIGNFNEGLKAADSAIYYNHIIDRKEELNNLKSKLHINHMLRNYNKDYDIAMELITISDSLNQEMRNSSTDEISTLMGLEKAQKEAILMKAERKTWVVASIIGSLVFILVIVIAIIIYRNNIRQRETNRLLDVKNCELEQQKEEILVQNEYLEEREEKIRHQKESLEEQNKIIGERNREMNDSINYASLIQHAAMPPQHMMQSIFGSHMLIFRPLKVVSGDFYWCKQSGNIKLLAVGDCTGHGVPGAFLSILGISILNELSSRFDLTRANAGIMLDEMRQTFKQSLRQTGNEEDNHDGIDIAIVMIDTQQMIMHYAGAFRPLLMTRNGELKKISPDRMPIGIHYKESEHFTDHEIKIEHGDRIYLFSDGITDQFGFDEEGNLHKFTAKRFGMLVNETSQLPFSAQQSKIEMEFDEWRREGLLNSNGEYEQTDDAVLVGIGI